MKTPEARFSPDISITVPDLDIDNDGIHDLSGTTIRFSFRPVAGSNFVCDLGDNNNRWVVGDDGSVTRPSSAVRLVDRPVDRKT